MTGLTGLTGLGRRTRGTGIRQDLATRILVVSDLHYRLPHYDWLVDAAADIDVVALVGDLADVVSSVPHEAQTLVLTNYLARRDGLQRQILGEGEQVGGHRSGLVEPADNG